MHGACRKCTLLCQIVTPVRGYLQQSLYYSQSRQHLAPLNSSVTQSGSYVSYIWYNVVLKKYYFTKSLEKTAGENLHQNSYKLRGSADVGNVYKSMEGS